MDHDGLRGPERPAGSPPVLDVAHLAAQTLDDQELARQLLSLFAAQCHRLRPILAGDAAPQERPMSPGEAAHMLKGAALAIGAGRVAACADAAERAALAGHLPRSTARDLVHAMDEICGAIGSPERRATPPFGTVPV